MNLKRRYITLIEIMIVMFLIALIIGVVSYNYRGVLDEGKAFKTRAAIEKLENILNLSISENPERRADITSNWPDVVRGSPLVSQPEALLRDGWGTPFTVSIDDAGNVRVTSENYTNYTRSHPQSMFKQTEGQ